MKNTERNIVAMECIKKTLEQIYVDDAPVDRSMVELTMEKAIAEAGLSGIKGLIKSCFDKVLREAGLVTEEYWTTIAVQAPTVETVTETVATTAPQAAATFLR